MFVKNKIYLDVYATMPMSPHNQIFTSKFLCNMNPHAPYSNDEPKIISDLVNELANIFSVKKNNILLNSGGSEGNSTIINSICCFNQPGKNVICSSLDHPSVTEKIKELKSAGMKTKTIPVKNAQMTFKDIQKEMDFNTCLVILTHTYSEAGQKNNVEKIAERIKYYFPKIWIHVDYVQGFMKDKKPLSLKHIDSVSLSFHKIGGLKGAGCLVVKNPARLMPLISGKQNFGKRGGTCGPAQAASAWYAIKEMQKLNRTPCPDILNYLINSIQRYFSKDKYFIYTNPKKALGNCLVVAFKNVCNKGLQNALLKRNFIIGTGSACKTADGKINKEVSPVVTSYGVEKDFLRPIRISWSQRTKKQHIDKLLNELIPLVHRNLKG